MPPGSCTRGEAHGERDALTTWSRRVVPTVRAFLEQWELQRRTLLDWLGRPDAAWEPGLLDERCRR